MQYSLISFLYGVCSMHQTIICNILIRMDIDKIHLKEIDINQRHVITKFNYDSLIDMDEDRQEIGQFLYKVGDFWKDWKTLYIAIKTYAAITGFSVCTHNEYIQCNRYGTKRNRDNKKNETSAQQTRNMEPLKIGCTFSIK